MKFQSYFHCQICIKYASACLLELTMAAKNEENILLQLQKHTEETIEDLNCSSSNHSGKFFCPCFASNVFCLHTDY